MADETKMGRPTKAISMDQFEKLCQIQCTKKEICDFFEVSDSTISRWCKKTYNETFEDIYEKKSAIGKMSLRRIQFKLAEKNTSMAIFLGKQYLGQRDQIETNMTTSLQKLDDLLKEQSNA